MTAAARLDEALRLVGRLVAFLATAAGTLFLVGVLLRPVLPDGLPMGRDGETLYALFAACAFGVANLVMVAGFDRGDWRFSGLGEAAWRGAPMLAGLALGASLPGLAAMAAGPLGLATATGTWAVPATDAVLAAVAFTLVDAFAFRGYAIGLVAARWGVASAAILAAIGTVALHVGLGPPAGGPEAALDAFALALLLGVLRLRTRSLPAAWLAHVAVVAVREASGGPGAPVLTAPLFVVVTFLLYRWRPGPAVPGRA